MRKEAILYSIDEKITISQLKKLKEINLDDKQKDKFLQYCKENSIKSLFLDEIFLKKTKKLPYILYYIWNYEILKNKKLIGIVWPRQMTQTTVKFVKDFFNKIKNLQNIAIVSWLADGVDVLAHNLAIENNIPTVSVLWFGLAKWLVWTTRHLIKDIVENGGLVLSEFKLKQTWTNWTFPQRNRIIAGLSDILFTPQAREKSWTLITVEDALGINIPVYSCFSSIDDKTWIWTNKLINKNIINWIYDWNVFLWEIKTILKIPKHNEVEKHIETTEIMENEKLIFQNIQKWNNTLELLCNSVNLDTWEILNLLSILEISGYIQEINWEYIIT